VEARIVLIQRTLNYIKLEPGAIAIGGLPLSLTVLRTTFVSFALAVMTYMSKLQSGDSILPVG